MQQEKVSKEEYKHHHQILYFAELPAMNEASRKS
jgi:hypothetical protein